MVHFYVRVGRHIRPSAGKLGLMKVFSFTIALLFSLSSFVNAFMMNPVNDMAKVYWVSSVIALEMLGILQVFLVWFLYHTFALRFYLTRILTGKA